MRNNILMLVICFSVVLICDVIEARPLVFDDFKNGKINDSFWDKKGGVKAAWKVDKFQSDNRLEVHRIAGDGNGADDFGFGTIKFKDFGIQLDFYLLEDPFPTKIEILFRASIDLFFYQLIVNPVNGAGKKNIARWYRREGEDRGTWTEYIEHRAELPIPVETKAWYTLSILGRGSNFELYIKRAEDASSKKVCAWRDPKNLHPEGVMGIHTNQLQHYYIDNVKIYDKPTEVELNVESHDKLAVTWGEAKTMTY